MMLFEVWKDGRRIACTDHEECVPDARRIAELKKAGYKIKDRRQGNEQRK